jgi:hypothetical protein
MTFRGRSPWTAVLCASIRTATSRARWMLAVGLVLLREVAFAVNPTPVQLFSVPFPEDQLLQGLQAIESSGPSTAPASPVTTFLSIAAVADGTIVYYDQWENGYDADIANPANLFGGGNPDGTQIWGDGNAASGAPPGVASDLITSCMSPPPRVGRDERRLPRGRSADRVLVDVVDIGSSFSLFVVRLSGYGAPPCGLR